MWPTVINTAVGVRSIPQDYLNVGRVLKLPRAKMLRKVIIPATLPYVFTGCRLSLGIAWLVIVASEMLTGALGVGGFLMAGVQQSRLLPHPPLHTHYWRDRVSSRSAHGPGRTQV